jgi:hypothetical protein
MKYYNHHRPQDALSKIPAGKYAELNSSGTSSRRIKINTFNRKMYYKFRRQLVATTYIVNYVVKSCLRKL